MSSVTYRPLLFLIYINDLPYSSSLFGFIMYADDTTLYCSIDKLNPNNRNDIINEHLDKVGAWMKSNKLVLNSRKTKYMPFHKHNKVVPNLDLNINGSTIDQVSTFKFLGLHINSQLTCKLISMKYQKEYHVLLDYCIKCKTYFLKIFCCLYITL